MNILELLEFEEGYRAKPYYCSEQYPTIGIGQKIGPKNASLEWYQFTVPREVALEWLDQGVAEIDHKLLNDIKFIAAYNNCNEDRKAILISMCYQMGVHGAGKFRKMLAAMQAENWQEAAKQALDSKWARQTPKRASRHAKVIETGTMEGVY